MLIILTSCDIFACYIQADKVLLFSFFSPHSILTSFVTGIAPMGTVCIKSRMGTILSQSLLDGPS